MKKLDYNHLTTGALTVDASHLIGVVNDLIDLVNSQQEAIGELQTEIGVLRNMVLQSQEAIEKLEEHVDHEARHVSEQADDTQLIAGYTIEELKKIADTHRTVTLRIPKGMRIGEAISEAVQLHENCTCGDPWYILDTDLQKALDELKGEPNE